MLCRLFAVENVIELKKHVFFQFFTYFSIFLKFFMKNFIDFYFSEKLHL